jgi:DNA polymerase-3 subunit delta
MATKTATRLLMLSGGEPTLRRRALAGALDSAGVVAGDLDFAVLDPSLGVAEWVGQAGTSPFFAERRVIVVRHLLRVEPDAKAGLDRLPESALLILVADEELGDDSRQARLKTLRGQWEKLVQSSGGKVETFEVNPKDVIHDLRAEASRVGKTLSERSSELLAEMVGGSLSRGIEELEKLAIFVGEEPAIRERDIETLVVPSREWNVFKLIDAAIRGEVAQGLVQLRVLVGSPQKAEDAAFRSVLPQLSRQLRLLWQARVCIERKLQPDSVPSDLAELFPTRPNLTKEAPYRQRAIMAAARNVDYQRLARGFQLVSDADARLKGLLPAVSAAETLERLVLELCAQFAS